MNERYVGKPFLELVDAYVLDAIGSYTPLFVVAGAAYFLALLSVHLLSPRLARVDVA